MNKRILRRTAAVAAAVVLLGGGAAGIAAATDGNGNAEADKGSGATANLTGAEKGGDQPKESTANTFTVHAVPKGGAKAEINFVCNIKGGMGWSDVKYDPATIPFMATTFCGGRRVSEIADQSVKATLLAAETGDVEAEAPRVTVKEEDGTAATSNGSFNGAPRASSHIIRLDMEWNIDPDSDLVWLSDSEYCKGAGTKKLTCAWDLDPIAIP